MIWWCGYPEVLLSSKVGLLVLLCPTETPPYESSRGSLVPITFVPVISLNFRDRDVDVFCNLCRVEDLSYCILECEFRRYGVKNNGLWTTDQKLFFNGVYDFTFFFVLDFSVLFVVLV